MFSRGEAYNFNMDFEEIYKKSFKKYGQSPKALHWISYASQAVRFKYLVNELEVEDKSILDAGCGMGDLLPFLYARADKFKYLGIDINKSFIEVAKQRYSGHSFKVADAFSGKFKGNFNLVICSGVLNHNTANWLENRQQMIAMLFKLTNDVLAFNMAGSFSHIPSDTKIAYADAQKIYNYCLSLSPKVSIKTGYSNYDFTIIMSK